MLFIRTAVGIAHTLGKLLGGKQTVSFHHPALAVQPFGFNWVEPGTFGGQVTDQYPHTITLSFMLHLVVVFSDPLSNLFTHMPRCVVPYHHQHSLAPLPQFTAAPLQVAGGHCTYWPAIHKAQQHFIHILFRQPQPVTSNCFRVHLTFGYFFLDQAQRLLLLGPTVHPWLSYSAPPYLVLETKCPIPVLERQSYQQIPTLFFRAYCGSGEAIHSLALGQRTPNLSNVARTVSADTRSCVSPCSKLTSATNANAV